MSARISRMLLVSPNQSEMLKRNRSRVFIWPKGDTAIDAMLFQQYRPIEPMLELAERAIEMAGLRPNGGPGGLDIVMQDTTTGMQEHFSHRGWLANEDGKVFDVIIEAAFFDEVAEVPDVETMDPIITGDTSENPLIIMADVDALRPTTQEDNNQQEEQADRSNVTQLAPRQEQQQEEQQTRQSQPVSAAARRDQEAAPSDMNEGQSGRMAGKPGRVRNPLTDGRLKRNRINQN